MKLLLTLLVLVPLTSRAGSLGKYEKIALEKTQKMLLNKTQRDAAFEEFAGGVQAKQKVSEVAGSAVAEQEIFELASDIMGTLTTSNDGDPDKMMKALADFERNPASIESLLTDAQKKKLSAIAAKIEKTKPLP